MLTENPNVHELHYIRHKRVAAIPFLKRLETGSVLKGSRATQLAPETAKLIERRRSEASKGAIDWTVRSSVLEQSPSNDKLRIIELLDDATELAASLDILPNDRASIDVVFVSSDANINVSHINFYFRQPAFTFYFPIMQDVEESLLQALPAVMHELVHFRTVFDNRYRSATDPILSEEMTAYAAGQCASVWISRRGSYVMSIRRATVPSHEILLADHQTFGEGHAGRLLADSLIFPEYPEGKDHEVEPTDVAGIVHRCREVVRDGRGLDLQFINDRAVVTILR